MLPEKTGKIEVRNESATKALAASLNLNARMTQALGSDPALKASVEKDILAIRNQKNKAKRLALAKAFRTTYEKDIQRILGKAGIDLKASAREFSSVYPDLSVPSINVSQLVVGRPPESAPQPPANAPVRGETVRQLVGSDFQFEQTTDCAPGQGRTERSGGYLISETERCTTSGEMVHVLEVPAGMQARVEMTANLSTEAHVIVSFAHSYSYIAIAKGTETLDVRKSRSDIPNNVSDDAGHSMEGATIVRQLPPGQYELVARTSSTTCTFPFGWAVAEGKVGSLRVKITMTPL